MPERLSHPGEQPCPDRDDQLGELRYTFQRASRVEKRRRKSVELLGAVAAILVPLSLLYVHGWSGKLVAALAAVVALASYWLSGGRRTRPTEIVRIYSGGMSRTKADNTEKVVWNQIVDIDCHDLRPPNGGGVTTIAFEVVAEPPWFVVLGGNFSTKEQSRLFVEALTSAWLPVWCRRERLLVENLGPQPVGTLQVSPSGVLLPDAVLPWSDIRGVNDQAEQELLVTKDSKMSCDDPGAPRPFPSTARRIAALAVEPPSPPLLLGPGHPSGEPSIDVTT